MQLLTDNLCAVLGNLLRCYCSQNLPSNARKLCIKGHAVKYQVTCVMKVDNSRQQVQHTAAGHLLSSPASASR